MTSTQITAAAKAIIGSVTFGPEVTGRDETDPAEPTRRTRPGLILQQHFVVLGLFSLVVAGFGAVLVAASPAGPGPGNCAAGLGGDQVCQETADLAECDADEAAARADT